MSLIASNASVSAAPPSVLYTLPVGVGAFSRGPLGPSAAGSPPTRKGVYNMDSARPSTTVVHPAMTRTAHAHPNATARTVIDLEELPGDRCHLSPRCIRQPHLERRDDATNRPLTSHRQSISKLNGLHCSAAHRGAAEGVALTNDWGLGP